jgi:non-homologous end joining protein Ku
MKRQEEVHMDASWVGTLSIPHIKVSLPLKMAPASSEEKVALRMICREHGSTVEQVFQCHDNGEFIENDRDADLPNIGKGLVYKAAGPHGELVEHVLPIAQDEIDSLKLNFPQQIQITETRSVFDFDPAYIEQSYRVWTEPVFEAAWASLWRAMDRLQVMGFGIMILSKRGYRVALRASGKKEFTVYRLHWEEEMRDSLTITDHRADSAQVKAFTQGLEDIRQASDTPILPGIVNSYNAGLKSIIERKQNEYLKRAIAAS